MKYPTYLRGLVGVIVLLLTVVGCSSTPPREGPRVKPDPREWKRKPFSLPPLYMQLTSGSGNRWKMVTPLYWQVKGEHTQRNFLFPVFSYSEDRPAQTSGGHALNWFWRQQPSGVSRVLFPIYWNFESEESKTSVYGPLYSRQEFDGSGVEIRQRLILFPWLFSRETTADGYDYWGVCFRLFGVESQVFDGVTRKRLWLFFVLPIDLG